MRSAEMNIKRTFNGISLREGTKGLNMRQELGEQDLVTAHFWRDSVERMTEERRASWAKT